MPKSASQSKMRVKIVGRNIDDILPLLGNYPVEVMSDEDAGQPDLIISHGGDGSMLGAERQYPGIPKCPIRDDANNPKCGRHSMKAVLDQLFKGQLKRSQLDTIIATGPHGHQISGINDLVITRELVASAIRYRIIADGEVIHSQVIADSLVIATPFGSTGYFHSITGGSFAEGLGLAYNNAVDGARFDIIKFPKELKIEILRGPATAVADNNPDLIHLETGDAISLKLADCHTDIYGIDIFRCPDCFALRRNGLHGGNKCS